MAESTQLDFAIMKKSVSLLNTYPTALGMNYQSRLTGGYFGVVCRNVVIEDDQQEE